MSLKEGLQKSVIPAQAGIQGSKKPIHSTPHWMPAFAGMTAVELLQGFLDRNFLVRFFVPFVFFVDRFSSRHGR
jgi:hypothetical protein